MRQRDRERKEEIEIEITKVLFANSNFIVLIQYFRLTLESPCIAFIPILSEFRICPRIRVIFSVLGA